MTLGDRYSYRVGWSAEDEAYVGTVEELPSLCWVADSLETAFTGVRDLVAAVLADMADTGATPPPPALGDRSYESESSVRDHRAGQPAENGTSGVPNSDSSADPASTALLEAVDGHGARVHLAREAVSKALTALSSARAQLERATAGQDG